MLHQNGLVRRNSAIENRAIPTRTELNSQNSGDELHESVSAVPLGPCLHITSPGRPSPPEMLGSGTHLLLPTLITTLHMQSIANYLFTYLYSCETESPVAMGAVCQLQK